MKEYWYIPAATIWIGIGFYSELLKNKRNNYRNSSEVSGVFTNPQERDSQTPSNLQDRTQD